MLPLMPCSHRPLTLVTPQWRRVSPDVGREDFIGPDALAQLARPLLAEQWDYRQWGVSRGGQRAPCARPSGRAGAGRYRPPG
jgi:hypothetical protein